MLGFIKFNKSLVKTIILVCFAYFALLKDLIDYPLREIFSMIVYPLLVIVVANSRMLSVNLGRFGDLSYGIYLFHFPTIQALEHFGLYKFNPYVGFSVSVFVTIALATFSWHVVEKRFLKRSSHYIQATKSM